MALEEQLAETSVCTVFLRTDDEPLWAYSSVGRALEWHSRGQGFESPYVH